MNKKILIIEDNQELIDIYKMRFEIAGFDIAIANNGFDGITYLADNTPDLILLDIMMPEMSGFEVLESIKNNLSKEKSEIPIIIWSNISQESDRERAKNLGADLYLPKSSFAGNDLIERVQKFLIEKK